MSQDKVILELRKLKKYFPLKRGRQQLKRLSNSTLYDDKKQNFLQTKKKTAHQSKHREKTTIS